jgi:hypothetical protein
MLLVAQSGDKGASRPVLLTRGIPKRSSFGFTKQFLVLQRHLGVILIRIIDVTTHLWPPPTRRNR